MHVILNLADMYLMQRFIMRWRIWLSGRLIDDWLGDFAYFRRQFFRSPTTTRTNASSRTSTSSPRGSVASRTTRHTGREHLVVRRGRGGAVGDRVRRDPVAAVGALTLGGITLPRALFWIVIVYVLAATVVAFVIGRPLIQLSYLNELRNAGFRYALVRVRDASAAIGLYRGENVERRLLGGRLSEVMANYGNWLNRMVRSPAGT